MNSKFYKPTICVILGLVGIGTIYDFWAVSHNYEWTISANLWQIARSYYGPAIVFVAGFLIGHVLMPNKSAAVDPK